MRKYVEIIHNSDIEEIDEFFALHKIKDLSIKDFLDYNPDNVLSNKERIYKSYSNQDRSDLGITTINQLNELNCKLRRSVLIKIPKDKFDASLVKNKPNNFKQNNDFKAFLGKEIESVINSPSNSKGTVSKIAPQPSVWIWCKALSSGKGIRGGLIDISPFIYNLTTNVGTDGGNFSFTVAELSVEYDKAKDEWRLPIEIFISKNKDEIISKNAIHEDGQLKRNNLFFKNIIQTNDLVFISFDRLTTLTNIKNQAYQFSLEKNDLPENIFDMIGLIDNCDSRIVAESTDVSVSITGRDCMKLLIDDGTYFFPNSYANPGNEQGAFKNISDGESGDQINSTNNFIDGRATNRIFATSMIEDFYEYDTKTIQNVLNTLIGTLSNIKICDDELFSAYGERRTKYTVKTRK